MGSYLSTKKGRLTGTGGNSKGRKLTPKMISFIDQYTGESFGNSTQSILKSEYTTTNPDVANRLGAELLQHPLVSAEIKRRLDAKSAKAEVKAEYLIGKLTQIVESTQEENPQAAIRAIELLGKTIAIWKDRQEISGPDGEAIKHEQRVKESVSDFTRRIAELAKRNGTSNVIEFPDGRGEG